MARQRRPRRHARPPFRAVRAIGRYWTQERSAIRRSLVALLFAAVADLVAGTTLGSADASIASRPGLLVLIPAAIAMRGSTFGAMGARLGTAILTGQYQAGFKVRGFLWRELEAVAILTLVTSVEAALLAKAFSVGLGMPAISVWDLLVISVAGGVGASIILVLVVITLAQASFRRGWNMDDVGAPVITATGDLLTIPALLIVAGILAGRGTVSSITGIALLVLTVAAFGFGVAHPVDEIRRRVRESAAVLTIAATVSVFAGLVVESRSDTFLSTPALLVLFPPFVSMFGSLGGVLASRLSSKLHLGLVEPRPWPGRLATLDFSLTYLLSTVTYAFVGVGTWLVAISLGLASPSLLTLVGVALVGGFFGTTIVTAVAYTAATATHRFGLDPDNHAIPIVTSVMDFAGMLCLAASMAILGVG